MANRNNNKARSNGQKGSKSNGKSKRYSNNKYRDRDDPKTFKEGEAISETNDPAFYMAYEQLSKDAANLAYSEPLGAKFDLDRFNVYNVGTTANPYNKFNGRSVPGVFNLHISACPGVSTNESSAINLAARNTYAFIRSYNSGHTNYDAGPLMQYLFAMDSVYSMFSWVVRLYGTLNTYSIKNRYLPKALINGNSVNFTDLLEHIADFRMWINTTAIKIGSLCVPANIRIYQRHIQMYNGMYYDSPNLKASIYQYVPYSFYIWNESSGDVGYLQAKAVSAYAMDGLLTFDSIRGMFEDMLHPILTSEDFNIMSGDILKAYKPENIVRLPQIAESYQVVPSYDPAMLSQIQNSTTVGTPLTMSEMDITVAPGINEGYLIWNPWFEIPCKGNYADRLLTVKTDSPTPADNFDAMPLMAIALEPEVNSTGGKFKYKLHSCGSEVCHYYSYEYFWAPSTGSWSLAEISEIYNHNLIDITGVDSDAKWKAVISALDKYGRIEMFDQHPLIAIWVGYGSAGVMKSMLASYSLDVDNYTQVTHEEMWKIHEAALISEFAITQYGVAAL